MNYCDSMQEAARLEAVHRYDVMDTEPEEAFDRITRLVKNIFHMPIVLISIVDRDRQWFKSRQGMAVSETAREISFCTHAIQGDRALVVADALADHRFKQSPLVVGSPHVRFYAGVPLRTTDGHNVGTLCIMDTRPRTVTADQIAMLEDIARLVVDQLELRLLASVDSLTGAMARRSFKAQMNREASRSERYGKALACAVIDVDNLKQINDAHGHAAGDALLQRVAAVCKSSLRAADYFGRIGGDEFAALLPETTLLAAFEVMDRLRRNIEAMVFEVCATPLRSTVSIGIAEFTASTGDAGQLLRNADAALYEAKFDGKNRVACHFDEFVFESQSRIEDLSGVSS